jgi:hypothetical protein
MGLEFRRRSGRIANGSKLVVPGQITTGAKVFPNTFGLKQRAPIDSNSQIDYPTPTGTPIPPITPTTTPTPTSTPIPSTTPTPTPTPTSTSAPLCDLTLNVIPTPTPTNTPSSTPVPLCDLTLSVI